MSTDAELPGAATRAYHTDVMFCPLWDGTKDNMSFVERDLGACTERPSPRHGASTCEAALSTGKDELGRALFFPRHFGV